MRPRWVVIWLTVSVVLNAVLLALWLAALRPAPTPARFVERRPVVTNLLRPIRTNVVFQPRLLSWKDVESDDYATYVRNLRGIGCPPETVRDIIVSDINALFARRRLAEVPHPSHQWWRAAPDAEFARQAAEKSDQLERERVRILADLLGEGWDDAEYLSASGDAASDLGGPVLGDLSDETRRQVRAFERLAREASAGSGASSPAHAAQVERELRSRLAAVLTPEQLEEYLLRYSLTARRLRGQLRDLEVSPDEFRGLFRAVDGIESERATLTDPTDPVARKRLAELGLQEQAALEQAIGTARYLRLRLTQDATFRETWTAAERAGVAAEHVLPLYQVNQAALEERRRVLADDSLAPEEQTRLLADLYAQRLLALRALVGEDAFQRLQALEQP